MSMTLAYGGTTITLPSPLYSKKPTVTPERWQNALECGDGSVKAYDHDVTVYWIELGFRVDYTELTALRNFVKNTIKFSKFGMTVTPDANLDLGKGKGTAISSVYLWQWTIPEAYERPGLFDVKLLMRTFATGTGAPS